MTSDAGEGTTDRPSWTPRRSLAGRARSRSALACLVTLGAIAGPVTLVGASIAVASTPASARSPRDIASATAVVRREGVYLAHLKSEAAKWPALAGGVVNSLSAACPNVLTPLNSLPSDSSTGETAGAFVIEVESDITVAMRTNDVANATRLNDALVHLRWSTTSTTKATARLVKVERAIVALKPPDVCADARALVADGAKSVPAGTRSWDNNYLALMARRDSALTVLDKAVEPLFTAKTRRMIKQQERTVHQLDGRSRKIEAAAVNNVLAVLGLTQ